ncbi:hypothetical protein Mal52_19130 [Symmachiella dynata]|uniref:Uncharacterized protein n=1 Tax=Symmachiella dynata TaxID=2527995 RepID=A0A517ZLT1_9PLAN|nr:hypothetical protein Mal52_19130 [Symmachiella dynata]
MDSIRVLTDRPDSLLEDVEPIVPVVICLAINLVVRATRFAIWIRWSKTLQTHL